MISVGGTRSTGEEIDIETVVNPTAKNLISMGRQCYVQGCKSRPDDPEKPHFFRPKDMNTVKLWEVSIGRKDLKLKMAHSVCHKHFKDKDIIKKNVQGKDGPEVSSGLSRWRLGYGALPHALHDNHTNQRQSSINILPKLTVPDTPIVSEIRKPDQPKQPLLVPDNITERNEMFPKQIVFRPSWIVQNGILIRPNAPESNVVGVRTACYTLQTLSSPSCVTNHFVLNREEIILPSAWFWQEGFPEKKRFICSKFKWLDAGNSFEYSKSAIVTEDTRSLRYFVRGSPVFHEKLKPQFSTVNDLNAFLKLYDDIPECIGYTNPESPEAALPLNVKNRAKNCLLLASERSNLCNECHAAMTSPIHSVLTKNASNNVPNGVELTAAQALVDFRYTENNGSENISVSSKKTCENGKSSLIQQTVAINKSACDTELTGSCADYTTNVATSSATAVAEIPLVTESTNCLPAVFHGDDHPSDLDATRNGYSTVCDSNTENYEDDRDDLALADLALADLYLEKEIRTRKMLQRKFNWFSKVLSRSKAIGRSLLKATKEFEQTNRDHTKVKADLKAQCKQCGKVVLASRMKFHVTVHNGVKPHLCELCGRTFLFTSSLNYHIKTNHRTPERPKPSFMCSICGRTVCSKLSLKLHQRIHADERPFDCRYCDKKFREKGTLVRHIRTHTGEKPYACNICGTSYGARDTYVTHYRTKHQSEQSNNTAGPLQGKKSGYRCEFCPKEFCRKLAYEKHKATHTGVAAAVHCAQPACDFTYSNTTQLKDHMMTCHPEKAFPCSSCQKVFLSKLNLTLHQAVHDPARGYQCSYCPARLTAKTSLVAHEKIHTRETPHGCDHCEMRFHSSYLLQIHMRKHQPSHSKRKRTRKQ